MGQRPLVMPSRLDDPPEKLMWGDEHWAHVEGGRGSVELVDGNAYLAMSLRNVGNGTAVLQGWQVRPRQTELMTEPSDPGDVPTATPRPLRARGQRRILASGNPGCLGSGSRVAPRAHRGAHPLHGRAPLQRPRGWAACDRVVHPGAGREPSLDLLRRSALEPRSPEPALTAVYVSITGSGGRVTVIGSAWRPTSLQRPSSRRKALVHRRERGVTSCRPAILAVKRSTSTVQAIRGHSPFPRVSSKRRRNDPDDATRAPRCRTRSARSLSDVTTLSVAGDSSSATISAIS